MRTTEIAWTGFMSFKLETQRGKMEYDLKHVHNFDSQINALNYKIAVILVVTSSLCHRNVYTSLPWMSPWGCLWGTQVSKTDSISTPIFKMFCLSNLFIEVVILVHSHSQSQNPSFTPEPSYFSVVANGLSVLCMLFLWFIFSVFTHPTLMSSHLLLYDTD